MSDIHRLPLLGHDLPEVIEVSPEEMRAMWRRVKVYKSTTFLGVPAWRYAHTCIGRSVDWVSFPHETWIGAYSAALRHARGCC